MLVGDEFMKKIKIITMLLLLGMFLPKVNASTRTDTFISQNIDSYYYVDAKNNKRNFEYYERRKDNKITYSLDPNMIYSITAHDGYYDNTYKDFATNIDISKENIEKISLVTYYGYKYKDHLDITWYIATQIKIWEILEKKFEFTIPNEIKEKLKIIDTNLNLHLNSLDIKNKNINIAFGENYTYQNELLKEFHLTKSTSSVSLTNAKLTINPQDKNEKKEIILTKNNNDWSTNITIYKQKQIPTYITVGNLPIENISFNYTTIVGSIKLKSYDKDTNVCIPTGNGLLENITYGIYNEKNSLINMITLNNCEGTIPNLKTGTYHIKRLTTPKGYMKDENSYEITLTQEENQKEITLYNEIIKNEIQINTYYLLEDNSKNIEKNVNLDIYSKTKNTLITSIKTNEEGIAKIILSYDEYEIIENRTKEEIETQDKIFLSIKEKKEDKTIIEILNKPFTKKMKIQKVDEKNNLITSDKFAFKIYDTINQRYYCENKSCVYHTNELGFVELNNLYYSEYVIEELKMENLEYIMNEEKTSFKIDKDTLENNTIYLPSKKITGSLKLLVTNEENIPLKNIEFSLIAYDSILENNTILYEKDERITNLKTDNLGLINIKNLPLGKYYLKEIEKNFVYFMDNTTYLVEINLLNPQKELTIIKKKIERNIEIEKVNEENIPLENIKLALYAKENILDEENNLLYKKDELIKIESTDKTGKTSFKNLPLGKFYIKEISSIPNYLLDDLIHEITFEKNNELIQTQKLKTISKEPLGIIRIIKTDEDNMPLQNAKFKIFALENIYQNGKIIFQKNDFVASLESDELGIAEIKLPLGKYHILEIETPFGYWLGDTEREVDIKYVDEYSSIIPHHIYWTNPKVIGKLFIHIKDKKNIPINNITVSIFAEKDILDPNGKIIFKKDERITTTKSDNLGNIEVELPLGKYYITVLNEAYEIEENKYKIEMKYLNQYTPHISKELTIILQIIETENITKEEIKEDKKDKEKLENNIENEKINKIEEKENVEEIYDIPNTGKNNNYMLSIILLTSGGFLYHDKKRKNRHNMYTLRH